MDKGYDIEALYAACEDRQVRPIMPPRLTPAVKAGADEPPTCEHGRWQFAGSDYKRKAAKWRCPTKERKPGSRWIKASRLHTLIPRQRPLAQALPRTAAVERRPVEARMEPAAHPRARYRAGPATRRPDDPRQARLRPRQGATPYRSRHSSKVKDPCVVRCSTSRASFATTGIGVSSASRSTSL
jgi:hypothetical protein